MTPKVFISHAHEDKTRFVTDFAKKLRAKGIDAWVDTWELLPGDSLVDKIFEEGIKNANAIIVVLSQHSVNKRWVKEELNAAMVRKINGLSKLIPVVLDDCEVPEALRSTLWIRILDLNSYNAEFESIVRSIFDQRDKPPLGRAPRYAANTLDIIPNLTQTDTLILKLACEKAIQQGDEWVEPEDVWKQVESLDVGEGDYYETLEILHSRNFIEGHKYADGTDRIRRFQITLFGFEQYARVFVNQYDANVKSVAMRLVNNQDTDSIKIAAALGQPLMMVNHIIEVFESKGWIGVNRIATGDGNLTIYDVYPEFKRWLRLL